VLSGYTELQSVTDAINEGAIYRFLTKPWDDVHLHEQLQDAFKYKDTLEENRQLDLKTRTANQELAAANRRLTDVLELKNLQLELDRSAMRRLVEAWQSHPWPVLGIDTEGRVAFANAAAQQLPSDGLFALGVKLSALLPTLDAAMADPQNSSCQLPLGAASYQANWHNIGGNSQDLSKIVTLRLTPPIPEINQNSEVT
jgi:nitrogen fixation/metabolism regulation signal transduction histidine kinase